MPVRVGFSQHRRGLLDKELDRILEALPRLAVHKAILIGSLATPDTGPSSDINLIIVHETEAKFTQRMDFFTSHLDPTVAINFLVYTPEEFEQIKDSNPYIKNAIQKGNILL